MGAILAGRERACHRRGMIAEPAMPLIRRLTVDDVAAFRAIRLEALTEAPAAFASTAADFALRSDAALRITLAELILFAAFRDGEPVGLMGLMRNGSSKMAHRATVIMVYVRASERGRALADALLATVTDHARGMGLRQLELAVAVENAPALAFYHRQGFAEVGRIPAGFLHEGREIDEILMMRRIT